jgi:SAM-dependent methyltransferase
MGLEEKKEESRSYKDFWENVGGTYETALCLMDGSPNDEVLNLTGEYTSKRIARALMVDRRDRIFELGCGVGRLGAFIAPLCFEWYGFDISESIVRHARERMKTFHNVNFRVLEKTELKGIPENHFDKGYSHAVFLHMDKEDVFLYLREVYRVLKPGGLFYFDTWNLANEVGWERWLWEVEAWDQSDQSNRKHVSRNQFSVPQEIRIYVEKAGFSEIFCLEGSFWIQALAMKPKAGEPEREKVELIRKQIYPHLSKIGIPHTLNVLYRNHLQLIKGSMSPLRFYDLIQGMEEDEEVRFYRNWLKGVWKHRQNEWGSYPGETRNLLR